MATSNIGRRRQAAQEHDSNPAYQRRRQEIIEAAAHVFKKKGFQGASLGDVAEHLGTDRANLYYYVGSKEELLDGAVTEAVVANLALAKGIQESELSPPEKIREIIQGLMRSYATHFPFLYVYIQENLNHVAEGRSEWAQRMRDVNREYEHVLVDIITVGQSDGSLKSDAPPWVIAYGILGLVGWTNRWFDPERIRDSMDAERIGSVYAEAFVSGIATD